MRATEKDRLRLETEISRLVEQMKNLGATKLILFGSLAREQISLFSDIDMLVIFESERSPRELTRWAYQNVETGEALDIIAHTPKSLEAMRDRPFIKHILKEGKLIHERS
jgi:predicted nucleotidyltransferase